MLTGTEVNQLAILQTWPRIWIRGNWEQIQAAVRVGLQLGAFEIQVRGSNSSEWKITAWCQTDMSLKDYTKIC